MLQVHCEELEMKYEDLYPNYNKAINDFMSDKNKELEFRNFIHRERNKECKI